MYHISYVTYFMFFTTLAFSFTINAHHTRGELINVVPELTKLPLINVTTKSHGVLVKRFSEAEHITTSHLPMIVNPKVDMIKLSEEQISRTIHSVQTSKQFIRYAYEPYELPGHGALNEYMRTVKQTESLDLVLDQLDQNIHYIQENYKESFLNIYKDHVNNINSLIKYMAENNGKASEYLCESAGDNNHENIDLLIISKSVESVKYLRFLEEKIKKEHPQSLLKKMFLSCFVSQEIEKNAWIKWATRLRIFGSDKSHKFHNIQQEAAVEEVYLQALWSKEFKTSHEADRLGFTLRQMYLSPQKMTSYDLERIQLLYKSFVLRNIHPDAFKAAKKYWSDAIDQIRYGEIDDLQIFLLKKKAIAKDLNASEKYSLQWIERRKKLTEKLQNNIEELEMIMRIQYFIGFFPLKTHDFLCENFSNEYKAIEEALEKQHSTQVALASILNPTPNYIRTEGHVLYPNLFVHSPVTSEEFYGKTLSSDEITILNKPGNTEIVAEKYAQEDIDLTPFLKIPFPGPIVVDFPELVQVRGVQELEKQEKISGNCEKYKGLKNKINLQVKHSTKHPIWTKYGPFGTYLRNSACARMDAELTLGFKPHTWDSKEEIDEQRKTMISIINEAKAYPYPYQKSNMVLSSPARLGKPVSQFPTLNLADNGDELNYLYISFIKYLTEDEVILSHLVWLEEGGPEVERWRQYQNVPGETRDPNLESQMKNELQGSTFTLVEKYILYNFLKEHLPTTLQGVVLHYFDGLGLSIFEPSFYENELRKKVSTPLWKSKPLTDKEKDLALKMYTKIEKVSRGKIHIWDKASSRESDDPNDEIKENLHESETDNIWKGFRDRFVISNGFSQAGPSNQNSVNNTKHKEANGGKISREVQCAKTSLDFKLRRIDQKIEFLMSMEQNIKEKNKEISDRVSGLWNWYEQRMKDHVFDGAK